MVDVAVKIVGGRYCSRRTNTIAIEMGTAEMMKEVISQAKPIILEPMMDIEISTPKGKFNIIRTIKLENV